MKKINFFIYIFLIIMFVPVFVDAESLSVTDCDNNTLYTTVPSNLSGLAKIMANKAYLDNGQSQYVTSCDGIDFSNISSNTNGNGIYEIASTKNDDYPIYYYRGSGDNNNVKFAGFCWKAIRTTYTGGVKLIYNGKPDSNGNCTNTTGTNTQIGTNEFNTNDNSPAYVGYMYGTIYNFVSMYRSQFSTPYVFGNDVTYSNGTYTLTNTMTSTGRWRSDYNTLNNHHYTCFSTGTTCTSVYYVFHTSNPGNSSDVPVAYYIVLTKGKNIETVIDDMLNTNSVNTTNSLIKGRLDRWYNSNLSRYTSYIEDTVYCNDRSISEINGWNPNGGDTTKSLYFSPRTRFLTNYTPNLACTRELDRFTVSSTKGNGALTYPVGLITSDEVMYAGGLGGTDNNTYYLYTNLPYWTNSPSYIDNFSHSIYVSSSGGVYSNNNDSTIGVRPVISVSPSNIFISGNGTRTDPYYLDVYHKISIEENDKTKNISFDIDDISNVKSGKTVTFNITPIDNYSLDNIRIIDDNNNEITYSYTDNEYSFTMPNSDVTIIPTYKKNKYKVSVNIENETEDFNINVENMTSVLVGENVVFKVTPIKGYRIDNIRIIDSDNNEISFDSTGNNNEYSFIMPESDVTIIPRYSKVSNSVNVLDNQNSKEIIIEVNDSKAVVYEDVVVFKIVPEDGYEIKDIIITDKNKNNIKYEKTSNKNEYKFIMPDSDVLIKPIYRKIGENNKNNVVKNPSTGIMFVFLTMLLLFISLISRNIVKKIHSE